MRLFSHIIFIFITISSVLGQKSQVFEEDSYVFKEFTGNLKYSYIQKNDSIAVNNGAYSFNSNIKKTLSESILNISKIELSGAFHEDKKDKNWTYREYNYDVEINDIAGTWKQSLNYELNGSIHTYNLTFNKGVPSGQWSSKTTNIRNGIQQKESTNASVNFLNGTHTGNFFYNGMASDNENLKISGTLNTEGFADGEITIEYSENEQRIIETRMYNNGFLLSLTGKIAANDSVIYEEVFHDVKERLENLSKNGSILNYTISEKGFGFFFDNGYNAGDSRNFLQTKGNDYLFEFFHLFDKCFVDDAECFVLPRINFTRRFKYLYPETDDSMIVVLKEKVDNHLEKLNDFVENPKYIINRQKSDSLSYLYAYIQHSLKKVELVSDVVSKVESGFFDFLYRPNYYKNGVEGLNRKDTVEYKFDGKTLRKEFIQEKFIDSPENLLSNLFEFVKLNEKTVDEFIANTNSKIKIFEKQEQIDSLETKIVKLNQKIDSLYGTYNPKDLKDLPLVYKVHSSITNRLTEKLSKEFINTNVYEEKISTGNKLVCLLRTLRDNYELFSDYEKFDGWMNKKFTVFQKNPFDDRLFEGRILGNIEKSGRILHKFYYDEILKANSCQAITDNVENINKLKKQIEYFIENNDGETQQINKALRRETMPARIERLFYQTN